MDREIFTSVVYEVSENGEAVINDFIVFLRQLFVMYQFTKFGKALKYCSFIPLTENRLNLTAAVTYTSIFLNMNGRSWILRLGANTSFSNFIEYLNHIDNIESMSHYYSPSLS